MRDSHLGQMVPDNSEPVEALSRLAAKIRVTDTVPLGLATPCWAWAGAHDQRGYARVRVAGRVAYVRRIALQCHGVALGKRRHVISLCRDPGCVNPSHHLVGTKEEARDFGRFGRFRATDFVVAQMAIANGEITTKAFARLVRMSERLLVEGMSRCAFPAETGVERQSLTRAELHPNTRHAIP